MTKRVALTLALLVALCCEITGMVGGSTGTGTVKDGTWNKPSELLPDETSTEDCTTKVTLRSLPGTDFTKGPNKNLMIIDGEVQVQLKAFNMEQGDIPRNVPGKPVIWGQGAEHVIAGPFLLGGYVFEPVSGAPLIFEVDASRGYVYSSGRGLVTDPQGKKVQLNEQSEGMVLGHPPNFWTPLMIAAFGGSASTIKRLLDSGVDVNATGGDDGATALSKGASNGHLEVVKLLIEKGADVNRPNNSGETPLMMAALGGHSEVVGLLLAKGADPNTQDKNGITALISACLSSDSKSGKTVDLLLLRKVDPNVLPKSAPPALMFAAAKGCDEVVRALLAAGADVNTVHAASDTTPLIQATLMGHVSTAQILVEAGAIPGWKGKDGKTALDYALENNRPDVANYLSGLGTGR